MSKNETEIKATILRALSDHKGDDLYRAKQAFLYCTRKQMGEQYGESGKTRQQIVDEYAEHVERVRRAEDWVRSQL
jgi:ribosome-binding protein aMBF1 (putative translation factor)